MSEHTDFYVGLFSTMEASDKKYNRPKEQTQETCSLCGQEARTICIDCGKLICDGCNTRNHQAHTLPLCTACQIEQEENKLARQHASSCVCDACVLRKYGNSRA
jgi:hypothetical protein